MENMPRRGRVIRASEIGEYIYCHRAWWPGRVKGVENANRAGLEAGIERHRSHGRRVRAALLLQRLAFALIAAALLVGALLLALFLQSR